jgi:acyl carrier protein
MGELHIGGDGLGRGYLNCPDLTAEKFIPNPFSTEQGARLYRSGDLARYLPDGNSEFLGRIDNQIKIRGYRIEPGEIQTVLGQHPSIRESVVILREESAEDRQLIAYVVAISSTPISASELRTYLQQKLPQYMVPSVFIFLDSLPLSPNGKVDLKALPEPDTDRPELEKAFLAPRTPTEELLAQIWSKVLKIDKVGVYDNFFDLGGHSLLATQVVSRVRDSFHAEILLRSLFEHPTVAGLAQQIEEAQARMFGTEKKTALITKLESLSDDEANK